MATPVTTTSQSQQRALAQNQQRRSLLQAQQRARVAASGVRKPSGCSKCGGGRKF